MISKKKLSSELEKFKINPIQPRELPYFTSSICPECLFQENRINVISAQLMEENNAVIMKKFCDKHGFFKDVTWSNALMWRRANKFFFSSIGLENPSKNVEKGCPLDCGLCSNHQSHTALGLIDITLKCNLNCPICFADAGNEKSIDPEPNQIIDRMIKLRNNLPVPTPGIQFAGGEPTMNHDLEFYIKKARELGFSHIMVATNGLRFAEDQKYVINLQKAGLNTVYLQFDGVTAKPYTIARGKDLRQIKEKAIQNCKNAGIDGIILVPTIIRGVNSDELGDIIRYALDRKEIIKCVNFQPVSFTGRINQDERKNMRITIPDVIQGIDQQTNGIIKSDDWYPISSMLPLGRALGLMKGKPYLELSAHPDCGMATFLVFDYKGNPQPISRIIDLNNLIKALEKICNIYSSKKFLPDLKAKLLLSSEIMKMQDKFIIKELINELFKKGDYISIAGFMDKVMMLGMMHFMDPYNLDLERVKYCDIHYATDVNLIPFCTQNIIHRKYR